MRRFRLKRFTLLAWVMLLAGMTLFSMPRLPRAGLATQESAKETSASVMLGVNPERTRAYDFPTVIQPSSVRWKTSKLFVVDRSYPFTLTFEGMPPGMSPGGSGLSSTTVWTAAGHGFTEPVMLDGTIYFTLYVNDGHVFAQHTATGGDKWRVGLPGMRISPVAVGGGAVLAGANDGTLFALNAATGQMLWTKAQKGDGFETAAPLIARDVVYFSSTEYSRQNVRPNGRIFALELETGKELWVYKTKAALGSAAYADKTVFVGDSESRLYALDEATGQERWKFKSSGGAIQQPAIKNGVVYFSAHDGSLHAVDVQSGRERWKSKEPKVVTSLALNETNIYFGGEDFNLYAVDIASGKINWVYKTKKLCHSPVLAGGIVAFTTGDSLLALDATTGGERWKVTELNKVVSAPIFESDAVYFLDGEGHLYSLK